jgi:hypothetical protein
MTDNEKTIEFLYDTLKANTDLAITQMKSVEARGAQAFTVGTVLLGLASFGSFATGNVPQLALDAFGVAVVAYLGAAFASLMLLRPAAVVGLPSPADMWTLRTTDIVLVKESLSATLVDGEAANDSAIAGRQKWASNAVAAVLMEGAAIGAALLLVHIPR